MSWWSGIDNLGDTEREKVVAIERLYITGEG